MRTPRHPILIAAATLLALALAPAAASAVSVTVTGDDGRPVAINPAAPSAIRNLRPVVTVAGDPGTRFSVAVTAPDGRQAAAPVACQDAAQPATIQVPYRGNGAYAVSVTPFTGVDATCATPAGAAAAFPFTIAGRVVLGRVGRFLLRDAGKPQRRALSLPVGIDPGSQTREVRFALNGRVRRDGALRGRSIQAPYANGAASLLFPGPGTYTVVARDAADGRQTPWSAPLRIRVVAPFDLRALRFPDKTGPRFKVLAQVREGGYATGRVSVAIARGNGPFRSLGRVRIDGDGGFAAAFDAREAGLYKLRFSYRGNGLVTPGVLVSRLRVGTAIVG